MPQLDFTHEEGEALLKALSAHDASLARRVRAALRGPQHTVGGGIHPTAVIGNPPEHRAWTPDEPTFAPHIDPTARIEAYVTVDAGLKRTTRIGARTWLLKNGTHVGHDAVIGDDVTIACGAKIGGHVTVEDGAFIGLNATVAPFRTVGAGAQVEAGAVVIHDVPPGARVGGNPARILPPRGNSVFTERPRAEREARPAGPPPAEPVAIPIWRSAQRGEV